MSASVRTVVGSGTHVTTAEQAGGRTRAASSRRGPVPALREAAFPVTPVGRPGAAGVLAGSGLLLLWSALAYLRLSPEARGTIWAEDGLIFLTQALQLGPAAAVVEPYAGYMHLLPRLVAAVAVALPLGAAELVLGAGAALVVGLAATTTYVLSAGHLPSRVVRLLLASMVVLLPVGGLETAANVANSHWFLMAAAFWALAARPTRTAHVVLATTVVVLAAASDPLTVVLAPLVLARLLLLRRRRDHVVTAGFAVATAAQLAVVLGTSRADSPGTDPVTVLQGYLAQVPFALLVGPDRAGPLFERHGWSAVAVAVALVVLAAAVALAGSRGLGLLALTAGVASVAFFGVPVTVSWSEAFDPEGRYGLSITGGRYLVVPMLLLLVVVAAGLQGVLRRAGVVVSAVAVVAVVAVASLTVVGGFRPEPDLRAGPSWDAGLAAAREACAADATLDGVDVKTAPADRRQWVVTVPCERLR